MAIHIFGSRHQVVKTPIDVCTGCGLARCYGEWIPAPAEVKAGKWPTNKAVCPTCRKQSDCQPTEATA